MSRPPPDARKLALTFALTLALVLAAAWPFREAWITGGLPGAGPDVVSTVWGMWWFQQSWTGPAWGQLTQLVNAPEGAYGAVLSPSSALLFALVEPLMGAGRAASMAALLQIAGLGLAVMWMCKSMGMRQGPAWAAGFCTLVGRYLVYDTGEGSLVAIAALPIPIGLALIQRQGWRPALGLGACITWAALENPYLAPVLPVAATLWLLWHRREWPQRTAGLAVGVGATLAVSQLFSRSANPDYPSARAGEWYRVGPWRVEIVDMPWSRASLTELLWPTELSWTVDASSGTSASGGLYLGGSLLLLAGVGLALNHRRAWPWAAAALSCGLLAMGSFPGGPFVLLNAAMMAWLRPLTQPTRFLVVTVISLSVLAGFAIEALWRRYGARALLPLPLLAADALLLGGLSLQPPSLALPETSCLPPLEGGVLIWPADARMADPSLARLLQMAHGQPAPHRGIASWRLEGGDVHAELQELGFSDDSQANPLRWAPIAELGYQTLLVQDGESALPVTLPEPIARCGGLSVYRVEELPDERAGARRSMQRRPGPGPVRPAR